MISESESDDQITGELYPWKWVHAAFWVGLAGAVVTLSRFGPFWYLMLCLGAAFLLLLVAAIVSAILYGKKG